jgi:RES domain-containing protein
VSVADHDARMTPHPLLVAGSQLVIWRLDPAHYGPTWDNGEGAYKAGGRWNSKNRRVVYCSLDPATTIIEVAVHKGFRTLDTVPHTLTSASIADPSKVFVVKPSDVPNPNWLRPGIPSAGQQQFGDNLLVKHPFVLFPGVVSTYSWNLVFSVALASGLYTVRSQEPFALDPRLHPPSP